MDFYGSFYLFMCCLRADPYVLSCMSLVLYVIHITMFYSLRKKGGSSYEDTTIRKSGLGSCMLFTSITPHLYKLYLFPIKISGAITDF